MSKLVSNSKSKSTMNKRNNYQSPISVHQADNKKKVSYEILDEDFVENATKSKTNNKDNKLKYKSKASVEVDDSETNLDQKTEDNDEWQTIKPKRNIKKQKCKELVIEDNYVQQEQLQKEKPVEIVVDENTDIGKNFVFNHAYKIWVHDDSKDWKIDSFDNDFFTITSVATFLQFFNNFHKFDLNTYSFYIMKSLENGSFIEPTWEHASNRNGMTCSLRIDTMHGIELLQQLCILMVNECLVPDMSLVNGISIGKKTNWVLIKIWTKDKDVDVSKLLPHAIINSYPNLCIKSKMNQPEY